MIFILGFCTLLHVLYLGYWKNRPSLATTISGVYLHLFRRYTFQPSLAIFSRNTHLTTTDPLFLCYRSYFVYGLANTAVYLICENVKILKCYNMCRIFIKVPNSGLTATNRTEQNKQEQYI
jgi:hypothetical protein